MKLGFSVDESAARVPPGDPARRERIEGHAATDGSIAKGWGDAMCGCRWKVAMARCLLAAMGTLGMAALPPSAFGQLPPLPEPPGLEPPDLDSEGLEPTADLEIVTPDPIADDDLVDPVEPSSPTSTALVDGFEGDQVAWREETSDAPVNVRAHERTAAEALEGQRSERIEFIAGVGSGVYYSYPMPRVPLSDSLRATLHVRTERPGVQLLGRVVLPNDLDPETGQPFFVNVLGTTSDEASGRWAQLDLVDLPRAVERQLRILRIKSKRPIRIEGAYLDRLVLNLYTGSGQTEVLIDGLRVGPVPPGILAKMEDERPGPFAPPVAPEGGDEAADDLEGLHADGRVRFNRNRLELLDEPSGRYIPWIPTIIDAPGAAVEDLRRHGFDVYAVQAGAGADEVSRAVDAGFLLMPMLGDPLLGAADAAKVRSAAASYPERESVAFWHLGAGLGGEATSEARAATLGRTRGAVEALGDLEPSAVSTLATGSIAGDLERFASPPGALDLLGADAHAWGATMAPSEYYNYLNRRRDLAALSSPEAFFWTRIDAVAPIEVQRAIYGDEVPPADGRPTLLPYHLRLATVAALSAGYRGIAYRGDAELTRDAGRARLIELLFLNAEIDLFQEVLARNVGTIHSFKSYLPPAEEGGRPKQKNYTRQNNTKEEPEELPPLWDVVGVGFSTPDERGTLLLVSDQENQSQWIPGQLAYREIRVTVAGHTNVSAWEIGLGGVRNVSRDRVPGGIELTLTDFGPSAWVLLTSDQNLVRTLERDVDALAPTAAALAIEQAEALMRYVRQTHTMLFYDGFEIEGADQLLEDAEDQIEAARAGLSRGEASEAYANARRASRPLHLLMRHHADRARLDLIEATEFTHDPDTKLLIEPISAPPLMSFNTLPQLEKAWTSTIQNYPFGENLLPSGEFEEVDPAAYVREGWTDVGAEVEGLRGLIEIEPDDLIDTRGSERLLRLRVRPEEDRDVKEFAPFQDIPIAAIQSPPVRVKRHQFLRISVRVYMPRTQPDGGGGGIVVRDSIGGELMQFRKSRPIPEWSRVVLYRRAPESGDLTVTLGLAATGGEAFFDDLRIEAARPPYTAAELAERARRAPSVERR